MAVVSHKVIIDKEFERAFEIMEVQELFDCKIPRDRTESLQTVDDVGMLPPKHAEAVERRVFDMIVLALQHLPEKRMVDA